MYCILFYFYCEIHLKYCQDTINRQFNSTMENNFAGKTACSLSPWSRGKIEFFFPPKLTDYFIQGVRSPFPYLWRHSSITSKYVSRHKAHEGKYCTFNKILVRKAQISVESYLVYQLVSQKSILCDVYFITLNFMISSW